MKEAANVFRANFCVSWNTGEYASNQIELFHNRGDAEKWVKAFRKRSHNGIANVFEWSRENQAPKYPEL